VVRTVLIIALAGCFSPDVRDCTVTCTNDLECVSGQTCGADHFCAVPERAGRCGAAPSDGGSIDGAGVVDAAIVAPQPDARIDAPVVAMVPLHIHIDGQGSVSIEGGATCMPGPGPHTDCMLQVPANVAMTLQASPMGPSSFQSWSMACAGSDPTCVLVPAMATDVGAQFNKTDGPQAHGLPAATPR
jgi:hypothetical protein